MLDTVIAIFSLAISVTLAVFYIRDRRHARFSVESEHVTALLSWHEKVVALLMRFRHLKQDKQDPGFLADMASLSALIEQGRFLFPNIDRDAEFGKEKPPAYRGLRNLALDFLVASYNSLREPWSDKLDEDLQLLQRHFTSIIFDLVHPKHRLDTIRALTDRYFVRDESFEGFLKHRDGEILAHVWGRE